MTKTAAHTGNGTYDVIVVGAGPGGGTAAAILAGMGHRVALLERARFPRYKVGESMIPYNYFPLERSGLLPAMQASDFPKKHSVQFVNRDGRMSHPFYFSEHMDHPCTQTWQVTRDLFDAMVLENARRRGAEVHEETKAVDLLMDGGKVCGVAAMDAGGARRELRAPVTVDASGGMGFATSQLKWREYDPLLQKLAVWTYYKDAKRDQGRDEGATTITYLEGKNWFWYIPLRDGRVSVGAVGDEAYIRQGGTKDLKTIFEREMRKNVWIEDHLAVGTCEGHYDQCMHRSYRARYCAMDGLVLLGDALSFLDPVFSTGLFLAVNSADLVADAVDAALRRGNVSGRAFVDYGETMRRRIEALRRLVFAFYAEDFSFKDLIRKHPEVRGDVTDVLIGNLDRDFIALDAALSEFLELPAVSEHGRAMIA
jgi:flavin-dependent dehydrogenase